MFLFCLFCITNIPINKYKIMKNLFDIKDQVIVITGGCGILGKNIANYLAEQGAKSSFWTVPKRSARSWKPN